MAWACVPRKESPPRISACRARRLREEGDEPDRWARAVRGARATRGGRLQGLTCGAQLAGAGALGSGDARWAVARWAAERGPQGREGVAGPRGGKNGPPGLGWEKRVGHGPLRVGLGCELGLVVGLFSIFLFLFSISKQIKSN